MSEAPETKPPVFNKIPVSATAGVAAVTALFAYGLFSPAQQDFLTGKLAFFVPPEAEGGAWYRYLTYAFLHGDIQHLLFNLLWFVIFFVPVYKYVGAIRSYGLFFAGTVAGALIFQYLYQNTEATHTLIGASAGVSALSGAAFRLIISPDRNFYGDPKPVRLFDFRFLAVTTVMIFINILSAAFVTVGTGVQEIAWQSHIAGYITGAILLSIIEEKK